jgi:acetyl coenzyme A synthetase (ADP forming)-like protein
MSRSLDAVFKPRSVAVIGASRDRGSISGEVFHNLVSQGFPGPVYPVNRSAAVVQSVAAYRSIRDVPGEVDLAVVTIPRDAVLAAVRECAEKGVRGLVVLTAGFAETGAKGREIQNEMKAIVRSAGMRMIGPNCLGLVNTEPAVNLNATFAPTFPPHGRVAFSSQSGAIGLTILDYARDLGIGISQFVSMGNKADTSGNDLLEYWEDDPNCGVILLYLESLGNPARFMQIASRVARKKPIAVVKSGRTEAGARAASSHTGALAGLDVAVDALLGQAGVLRTDTMEELFDLAMLLANQPVPAGSRVGILTNAGGPAIMASDACESRGLSIPPLTEKTVAELTAFLPPEASTKNPVDMIASATPASFERALKLLLADPEVDSVIVLFVPPIMTEAADVAAAIRRAGAGAKKPVVTCFMGTHGIPAALSSLREGRFPSYAFPEAAALALSRAVRYGRWLAAPPGRIPELTGLDAGAARAALGSGPEGRWLTAEEVRRVLCAYRIRTPKEEVASDAASAAAAAARIGFPVAVKLASATITHKTEVGGVVLGLSNAEAVFEAFTAIRQNLARTSREKEMDGALVQEMVPRGVETFVGVTHAPGYGPLLGFGTGGVAVEVWKDVAFRVAPITDADAASMLDQIRGAKLLDGFRGGPRADRKALVDTLLSVSRMVQDLPEIAEMDINPLVALEPGRGAVAVDARIRVRGTAKP